jgi:hypothetical protein
MRVLWLLALVHASSAFVLPHAPPSSVAHSLNSRAGAHTVAHTTSCFIKAAPNTARSHAPSALQMTVQELEKLQAESGLIGEDAAVFDVKEQRLISWVRFLAVLGTVLTALYYLWINNDTGFGDDFVLALESLSGGDRSALARTYTASVL